MNLTKKQLEFWTICLGFIIGVSVLILLIDFGIKAAILEESTRLRIKIEDWEKANGRRPAEANTGRTDNDPPVDPPFPSDLLVVDAPRMEAGDVPNGTQEKAATTRNRGRAKPRGQANPRPISDGNEQVG